MPSKQPHLRSHGRAVCASQDPKTGRYCTKKPGHTESALPKARKHSNEKPGYEIEWD